MSNVLLFLWLLPFALTTAAILARPGRPKRPRAQTPQDDGDNW